MLAFSICMLHLPTVSSYYYNPTRAKDLKRISAKQDSNQDWLQKGQLWLHEHVNSDRFDFQVPSLICDPTKKWTQRGSQMNKSFLPDLQVLRKKNFQIM